MSPREEIVAAAESWLRTPYHHAARMHRVGVDCVHLLCAAYEEAGLTGRIELSFYPSDWMLHRSEEMFLTGVLEHHLHEVPTPAPGDVVLFRYGRCYSHGAIVTDWPNLIHAFAGLGVVRGAADRHPLLDRGGRPRPAKFYSIF